MRGTQLLYLEDMSGDEGDDDYLDRHVAEEDADPPGRLQDQRMRQALVDAIKNPAFSALSLDQTLTQCGSAEALLRE